MAAISAAMTATTCSPFGLPLLLEQIASPPIKSSALKFAFNGFQMCSCAAEFFCRCYPIRRAGKGVRTWENLLEPAVGPHDLISDPSPPTTDPLSQGLGSTVSPELSSQFPASSPLAGFSKSFSLLLNSRAQEEAGKPWE